MMSNNETSSQRGAFLKSGIAIKILLAVLVLAFAIQLIFYNNSGKKEESLQVSIIVYGSDAERWENLRQGAELAASEYNAEISLVTMTSENNSPEQINLIEREIHSGVDALLIAACNSEEIGKYFVNASIDIPVVFVENGIEDSTYDCITADNYAMGVALAKEIIKQERSITKTAIIADKMERLSVRERYQGLYDTLVEYAPNIVAWERNDNEIGMLTRKYIQRGLTEEAVDVVVALNNDSCSGLIGALENLNKSRKVYAIANIDQAVSYLDAGKMRGLGYQNEFSIGYIAVLKALGEDKEFSTVLPEMIEYEVVTKDVMYQEKYQKLLFPFVK